MFHPHHPRTIEDAAADHAAAVLAVSKAIDEGIGNVLALGFATDELADAKTAASGDARLVVAASLALEPSERFPVVGAAFAAAWPPVATAKMPEVLAVGAVSFAVYQLLGAELHTPRVDTFAAAVALEVEGRLFAHLAMEAWDTANLLVPDDDRREQAVEQAWDAILAGGVDAAADALLNPNPQRTTAGVAPKRRRIGMTRNSRYFDYVSAAGTRLSWGYYGVTYSGEIAADGSFTMNNEVYPSLNQATLAVIDAVNPGVHGGSAPHLWCLDDGRTFGEVFGSWN